MIPGQSLPERRSRNVGLDLRSYGTDLLGIIEPRIGSVTGFVQVQ